MKSISIYCCDYCEFRSKDFDTMDKHEALHFGLSTKDKHTYDALLSFKEFLDSIEEETDKAIESKLDNEKKLIQFERSHGLIRGKVKYQKINNTTLKADEL